MEQPIELHPEQGEVVVNLDAGPLAEVVSRSVISGRVRGGGGAVVMLIRQADGEEWVTMARDDGAYRFVDLPPGRYNALVYPGGSQVEGIQVDGRSEAQIELAVSGWGYTIGVASDVQKVGAIVVSTPGYKGLRVQAHGADWSSPVAVTGEATEYGQFAACITPLESDYYIVTIDGAEDENGRATQLEARVQVDKRFIPLVEFVFVEPPAPKEASPAQNVEEAQSEPATQARPESEAGERSSENLVLAAAPAVFGGMTRLAGFAPDGSRRDVHVIDAVGNERWTMTDSEGRFAFEQVPVGVYSVYVDGGYHQDGIELDGSADVEILFAPVIAIWETAITNAGSMPGFSSVRVEVEGMANLPVRIWQGEEEGVVAHTGSEPHTGSGAQLGSQRGANLVEFRGLAPGRYLVEPEGLGIWAELEITGLEALWVSFQRKTEPVGLNDIRRTPVRPPGMHTRVAQALQEAEGQRGVYVFVAAPAQQLEQQLALLRYVAAYQPQVGNDLAEAAQAAVVLLVEDEQAPSSVEQELLLQNVTVVRAHGNWEGFLNKFGG